MLLYNLLYSLAAIFALPLIGLMLLFSPKRRKTFFKRLGLRGLPQKFRTPPVGPKPIWIHALSVGEVLSAEPLVGALRKRFPDHPLLFSTTTVTGHRIARTRFDASVAALFYFPYDLLFSVKRAAAAANPGWVVIVETDVWPNFLWEMNRRGVPVIFANARFSDRSFRGYRRLRFFMAPVFRAFAHICAQSDEDAERFRQLGVSAGSVTVTGNIKFDPSGDSPVADARAALRKRLAIDSGRPVLLAGSTHEGEESILKAVYLRLKSHVSNLLLIIVPRDPDRAASIRELFQPGHLAVNLMSALENGPQVGSCDVLLVDAIGVLKPLYALADVVFVGGSLVNAGGHNPLEPAAYAKPVLFGPDMSDFKDVVRMLLEADAGVRVHDADSLFDAVHSLLDDPAGADALGKRAFSVFTGNRGATDRTVQILESYVTTGPDPKTRTG